MKTEAALFNQLGEISTCISEIRSREKSLVNKADHILEYVEEMLREATYKTFISITIHDPVKGIVNPVSVSWGKSEEKWGIHFFDYDTPKPVRQGKPKVRIMVAKRISSLLREINTQVARQRNNLPKDDYLDNVLVTLNIPEENNE